MKFLERERAVLKKYLPGLDESLLNYSLSDLERPGSPAIKLFRDVKGPALTIPVDYQGMGASALDAVRVQRAIGSRSPSLAVGTTMHHFSVSSLVLLAEEGGKEWILLEAIAKENMLVASGFAEGRPDGRILEPTMSATVSDEGVRISGIKRPCSLSNSMDLLTASVMVPSADGESESLAVALIPASDPGVTVTPFWSSFALAGAESDQVTVDNVLVPSNLVVVTEALRGSGLDDVQTASFAWFELLMMGSYLGAASALVERVLSTEKVPENDRLSLLSSIEGAMSAVENIARQMPEAQRQQELLAQALLVRYAVQDTIASVVPRAVELLGGLNFMISNDVGYFAAAVSGLGFHPPARAKMAGPFARYIAGEALRVS